MGGIEPGRGRRLGWLLGDVRVPVWALVMTAAALAALIVLALD